VGGIGAFSNDCGGSSWFGVKLLAAVFGELFKCEPKTAMTGMMMKNLGVTDPADYVETLTTQFEEGKHSYASLNRLVFEAADGGDEIAIRILAESANHYAGGIQYLATHYDFPANETLHVALAGSVFTKEKVRVLPDLLAASVGERLPGRAVAFHILNTVPVAGAAFLASLKAGFTIPIATISQALAEEGL
jgi:N-acetylglucosamine kinase-like BadF-type ATPase